MTFRKYVNVHISGDKSDKTIIQKRNEMVYDFIHWLENNKHPLLAEVKKTYEDCCKILNDTAKEGKHIFPSVYFLLKKLKEAKTPHTLILRTYGKDLDSVIQELEKPKELGIKFKNRGKYIGQQLSFEIEEKKNRRKKTKIKVNQKKKKSKKKKSY